jgi:NADPH:quinone reductase-like Zn-dependent oxidoreductase
MTASIIRNTLVSAGHLFISWVNDPSIYCTCAIKMDIITPSNSSVKRQLMKAAVRAKYGSPDVLEIKNMEKPTPKDNEILIRVHAATVNRTDCGILWGKPFIIRFFTGLSKPKLPVTGTDFAGEIEAAGQNVVSYKRNDRVFGFHDNGLGSHSQYMISREDKPIALIPENLNFEQAAASLEGAHYAYNFIKKVHLRSGQKVLVNGATGAIGSAAVQLLKYLGLYVTAVCNTKNIELVKSLGADKIIDYENQDFTQDDETYEFVFDAVGKSSFSKCKPLLKQKGTYISSELGPKKENPFLALITPLLGGKKVKFPFPTDIKGTIAFMIDLIEREKFKPVIDRVYPLDEIAEAYNYVASGQKTGNVVITMGHSSETQHLRRHGLFDVKDAGERISTEAIRKVSPG